MTVPDTERRSFVEVRATARTLAGYAAVFGSEANLGSFTEVIEPGAFRDALAGDVLALLDHDSGKVLGRTRSGTLKLHEDSKGLAFELSLPETQAGKDVLALAQRNDLGGMSFGFTVPKGGETWQGTRRTLHAVSLKEISVVSSWPAYPDTEIAIRGLRRNAAADHRKRVIVIAEATRWD